MATTRVEYSTSNTITITLNSLTNGAARESLVIDNGTNKFLDAHVRVSVNAAAVSGTPQALVYSYGSEDGTTLPDPLTGTDTGTTLGDPTVLRLAGVIPTPVSSAIYESDVISIARLYGGLLPRKWGIVVVNNTGTTFNSTGCSASFTGLTLVTA